MGQKVEYGYKKWVEEIYGAKCGILTGREFSGKIWAKKLITVTKRVQWKDMGQKMDYCHENSSGVKYGSKSGLLLQK